MSYALSRSFNAPVNLYGLSACLVGIYAAYQFDEMVDFYQSSRHNINKPALARVVLSSVVLAILIAVRPRLVIPVLLLGILAILYVPLKSIISKNMLTVFAWGGAVVLLPFERFVYSENWMLLLGLFFILFANVILYDMPDVHKDRTLNIKSVTQTFGVTRAARLAAFFAGTSALIFSIDGAWMFVPVAVIYVLLGLFFSHRLAHSSKSKLVVDSLLLAPGLLALFI